jgi:hypothetical protein
MFQKLNFYIWELKDQKNGTCMSRDLQSGGSEKSGHACPEISKIGDHRKWNMSVPESDWLPAHISATDQGKWDMHVPGRSRAPSRAPSGKLRKLGQACPGIDEK